uniref:Uncharacterized protein n=1 Tax=Oryza nivara TaxID=4536 RepID=A0A0E0GML6_ORYNI
MVADNCLSVLTFGLRGGHQGRKRRGHGHQEMSRCARDPRTTRGRGRKEGSVMTQRKPVQAVAVRVRSAVKRRHAE